MEDLKYDNIVKVRDDKAPIKYLLNAESKKFEFAAQHDLNWCEGESFTKNELRAHIEPWLTSLFQSEHLSLLVGSGLTTAIQYAACEKSDNGMEEDSSFSVFNDCIKKAANESAKRTGREKANTEDQIRIVNELIAGLSIVKDSTDFPELSTKLDLLCSELSAKLKSFTSNIFRNRIIDCIGFPRKKRSSFQQISYVHNELCKQNRHERSIEYFHNKL